MGRGPLKPTTKSGWCFGEYTKWTAGQHDKCPENFTTRSCTCDCGHKGSKPHGWNNGTKLMTDTERGDLKNSGQDIPDTDSVVLDKPTQAVYTKDITQPRVSAKGATEALQALYK